MSGHGSWSVEDLVKILMPHWPDAERFLKVAQLFPGKRPSLQAILTARCHALGIDLDDIFAAAPSVEQLGSSGIPLGLVTVCNRTFYFGKEELPYGIAVFGSPGSGKTSAVCHIVIEAHKLGVGVLIFDLRGDYGKLASAIEGAIYIPLGGLQTNLLEPPHGIDLGLWLTTMSARFCQDLGLEFASQAYLIRILKKLGQMAVAAGVIPTVIDLRDMIARERPPRHSSEEGYRERVFARVETIVDVCGENTLGVMHGQPIIPLLQQGRVIVVDGRLERRIADLLCSTFIYRLYYERQHSDDPFGYNAAMMVLDEHRSLVRARDTEVFGVPDLDLLFSRSRALGMSFILAEQLPSQVSEALLTTCRLKIGLNTSQPETRTVQRLLGLTNEQAEELTKLPAGEGIVRLGGPRCPDAFRIQIPYPEALRD